MSTKTFLIQLSIFSFVMLAILLAVGLSPLILPYQNFGWISWIVFFVLSLGMFFIGQKAAVSKNNFAFTQVVILTMIVKMVLAFFLCVLYYMLAQPENKYFIIPLFIVYLGFTIFETYFMMKIGNSKSNS